MKKIIIIIAAAFILTSCTEVLLGPEPENTPQSNFEILWKTFDENYPLFGVKNINWDSLHTFYASKISSSTSENELWNITADLLLNLNDGHVKLYNKGYTDGISGSRMINRKLYDFSLELVKSKFLTEIKTAGDGYFIYGKVKQSLSAVNLGYIFISTFMASNSGNGYEWANDINNILNEFSGCDGIIIDVRNNGGGMKITGQIIASAFVDREITYLYQQEKNGPGHNDFGSPIALTVSPGTVTFNKNIALLTNRFSASGSEHFAQVLKNLPYSKQIGDTTFGAFGDIINNAQLPNGWGFAYPCRLTTTPDGKCPEGIGIIPDFLVENTKNDITAGKDKVMDYAINFLNK
ncbi:MAG: S41 family peptidase [Ignavibacteria bacterium]|nr:S41 family peptidase [Ignavibacteria bacterium]